MNMFLKSPDRRSKEKETSRSPSRSPNRSVDNTAEPGKLTRLIHKVTGQPDSYANKRDYIFGKTLGAGSFGVVRQARRVSTNEDVAIKILLKKALNGSTLQMLYDELNILQMMDHPNIVKFKDWFESKDKFYIVTQLATGGELFDRILKKGKFSEEDAVNIVVQMIKAVAYMHSKNVVHRDLKPENVLYLNSADASQLVISDFGIAKQLSSEDQLIHKAAGSMGYVAPEVLTTSGHGKPCDIWSLGVITYTLLCGYSPFTAESTDGFLDEVTRGPWPVAFHAPYWRNISKEAKEFILWALTLDPAERPTAKELLDHPWIKSREPSTKDLLPSIQQGFNASKKFREAMHIVILNNRIKKLKQLYAPDDTEDNDIVEERNSPLPGGSTVSSASSCSTGSDRKSIGIDSLQSTLRSLSMVSSADQQQSPERKQLRSQLTQQAFVQLVLAAKGNQEAIKKYQQRLDEEEEKAKQQE